MHAHLCLTLVHRLCWTRSICGCRWGAHGICYVCCRRSCLVFVVFKPRWPHRATSISIAKEHRHPWSISESSVSECVRLCDTHMVYIYSMACNDILRDIPERDPPRMYVHTYVHTYFVRIDPRFRASPSIVGCMRWRVNNKHDELQLFKTL